MTKNGLIYMLNIMQNKKVNNKKNQEKSPNNYILK